MINKFRFYLPLVVLAAFQTGAVLHADGAAPATPSAAPAAQVVDESWPPALPGAKNGTVTISTKEFLTVPAEMQAELAKPGARTFVMAKKAPTVDLAFHRDLPNRALNGTGWSAWGDIAVGQDGRVYSGVGDHGDNNAGTSHAYIYQWDPKAKTLKQIIDANKVVGAGPDNAPTWSKVHARILEGKNGKIYFTCTLNDGGQAFATKWSERVPGGQIFEYDPATGLTKVVATWPGEDTATTLLDRDRNIFYANLEGKTGPKDVALTATDLTTGKVIYQSPHDAVVADRNNAMDHNGAIYFNGQGGLWKYDPDTKTIAQTKSAFPTTATMRSSTPESKAGYIYGTTASPGLFFRYAPAQDKLDILGPDFLTGDYTTVTVLSPDERFVYYMPGSHGGAMDTGTPIVQYNIATGVFKVLGFLRDGIDKATGYVPAGSYGVKMSADGSTLYVNFNGQPHTNIDKHAKAFGLTAFAAIHIPASER